MFISIDMYWTEPTSSTAPRFASDSTNSKRVTGRPFTLLCPAQAYPAPSFRYYIQGRPLSLSLSASALLLYRANYNNVKSTIRERVNDAITHVILICMFIVKEPTSGSAPRFASDPTYSKRSAGRPVTLLCPAQAFPAPLFRWFFLFLVAIAIDPNDRHSEQLVQY